MERRELDAMRERLIAAFDTEYAVRGWLPPPARQTAMDADFPDCTTEREVELYEALMGLSSALMLALPGSYANVQSGGVLIWPIIRKALRLRH